MAYDHGAFQVTDMEKAITFYTEKLGFQHLFTAENPQHGEIYAFLEYNGARLELLQLTEGTYVPRQPVRPYCPHLCFETDDMDAVLQMLKENDIPILDGPNEIPGKERWVYFTDPDLNVLEYIVWM